MLSNIIYFTKQVSFRIYSLSFFPLIGFSIIISIQFITQQNITSQLDNSQRTEAFVTEVSRFQTIVGEMQTAVLSSKTDQTTASEQNFRQAAEAARVISESRRSDAYAAGITDILSNIGDDYNIAIDSFTNLTTIRSKIGHSDKEGLNKLFSSLGADMEKAVLSYVKNDANGSNSSDLLKLFIEARRFSNSYMISHDAKYSSAFLKAVDASLDYLNSLPTENSKKSTLVILFSSYRDAFNNWSNLQSKGDLYANDVTMATQRLMKQAEELTAAAKAEQNASAMSLKNFIDRSNKVTILISVLVTAGCLLVAVLVAKSISSPINRLCSGMKALASGTYILDFIDTTRVDDFGAMATALELLQDKIKERNQLQLSAQEESEKRVRRQNDIDTMISTHKSDMRNMLTSLNSNAQIIDTLSDHLRGTSQQVSSGANDTQDASQRAAENVSAVASASEELSVSVAEISSKLAESVGVAAEAQNNAVEARTIVSDLSEKANNINDVVNLISSISERTNLLALNASIEAARAGVFGKGFAVVAEEVKQLADQAGQATGEIAGQIGEVQKSTSLAVGVIKDISKSVEKLSFYLGSVASAIEEQSAATSEISRNAQEAATVTTIALQSAEAQALLAVELQTVADRLIDTSSELTIANNSVANTVDEFLEKVASV